jgi:hypothetical protein
MRNHFGSLALAVGLLMALTTVGTAQEKPGGGPTEGIKVHGHWTIEVREPDGTLVSRREFENSLQGAGPTILAELLAKVGTISYWKISMPDNLCRRGTGAPDWCEVVEPGTPPTGDLKQFPNLTVSISGNGTLLSGSFTADFDGQITRVATAVVTRIFSAATLTAPVPVSAGQVVQVKVIFSFS